MWFLTDLARLNKERASVGTLLQEVSWLSAADWTFHGTNLCLDADIEARGQRYPVRMIYPAAYPASPPTVRPRDRDQYWSSHQYGRGGELCLEWGPDNWHEEITGADMLRSAYKLLNTENPLGEAGQRFEVPSRHALTVGQELRGSIFRFVIDQSSISNLNSLSKRSSGVAHFDVMFSRENLTAFLRGLEPSGGTKWDNPALPTELKKTVTTLEGSFFKTDLEPDKSKFTSAESLVIAIEEQGYEISQLRNLLPRLVLITDVRDEPHLFWALDNHKLIPFTTLHIQRQADNERLSSAFANLTTKKVGIVGLGSAGSKIAVTLARSGVHSFVLVDHDLFLPENICRHELNWEDIGQHKVDGIAHRLKLVAPDVEVVCRRLMLSGQEATGSVDSALSLLGNCDLIVDATADSPTFNQLSHVACQYQKPFIWLEIFAGGIGGFVARFRPGRDPDPKTMRAYLLAYFEAQDAPEMKATVDYGVVGRGGEIVTASDADVGAIASQATRMILDILAEREPSIFPYSLYLVGLSRGWIFREPFHTIPLDLSKVETVSVEPELSAQDSAEVVSFLVKLIEKKKDESTPSP